MRHLPLIAALTILLSTPAMAQTQTWAMMLGKRQLGTLTFDGDAQGAHLLSQLDNTPLGVADGSFEATASGDGDALDYRSMNRGRKVRDIAISRQGGIVSAVTVQPESAMTALSDASLVPAGTLTPPEVFGVLATGTTCPNPLTLYDGRRVAQLATTAVRTVGDDVICDLSYRVVAGKGHLSPFNFKSLAMQTVYRAGAAAQITVSAGGFDVNLVRQ